MKAIEFSGTVSVYVSVIPYNVNEAQDFFAVGGNTAKTMAIQLGLRACSLDSAQVHLGIHAYDEERGHYVEIPAENCFSPKAIRAYRGQLLTLHCLVNMDTKVCFVEDLVTKDVMKGKFQGDFSSVPGCGLSGVACAARVEIKDPAIYNGKLGGHAYEKKDFICKSRLLAVEQVRRRIAGQLDANEEQTLNGMMNSGQDYVAVERYRNAAVEMTYAKYGRSTSPAFARLTIALQEGRSTTYLSFLDHNTAWHDVEVSEADIMLALRALCPTMVSGVKVASTDALPEGAPMALLQEGANVKVQQWLPNGASVQLVFWTL